MNKTIKVILTGIILTFAILRYISASGDNSSANTNEREIKNQTEQTQTAGLKALNESNIVSTYSMPSMGRYYSFCNSGIY